MHSKGIVHRNISPDNIIACDKKYMTHAKIIDFKFAAFEGHEAIFVEAGVPGFMAPETCFAKDNHLPEAKQDIFSLGAVLYSMLYGQYLFHA